MASSSGESAPAGPLTGLRVLDLSRVLAGPYCTMLLADAGADVIKVEPPAGDDTRAWGPPYLPGCEPREGYPGDSAYFASCNRNKRGIAVDLRTPEGQEIVRRLAARADVVVENFKLGTMERWGLGYEDVLRPLNPRLVYASISGFGRDGPDAELPGYDFVVQAAAGLMSITGEPDGEPMKVGVAVSDLTTGMLCAFAILAALWRRQLTGQGQRVDLSLLETQVGWLANVAQNYLVTGKPPRRYGNAHANIVPYQVLHAQDRPFVVAVGNDRQFERFVMLLGRPELASDPRFATNAARVLHRDELVALLDEVLRTRPAGYWLAGMREMGIPGGPVRTIPEVFDDPQVRHREMLVEVDHPAAGALKLVGIPFKFGDTPGRVRRPPPRLGEHTLEVLAEVGYTPAEVTALVAAGVVRALEAPRAPDPEALEDIDGRFRGP
ncbi:CaiB/BaiF CoA transferase family protein [Caldinitratiruptor microaerophilus]|uniref:CoA transferase n=1 Tax=Caldinitratiruptor microaerophilus TaxID=671077 RepID=A0AA35CNE7_9FIRM|nr:CoA transferase [Caldinitratiruptor microaerophilus]BDG61613.1 CoA transferase [Caldinitratiruptor microaerophilus]